MKLKTAVKGNIGGRAKEVMEKDKDTKLRHRIHQWSASSLVKLLEEKPLHVVRISEAGISSRDLFTGARISGFKPLMIRYAVKGLRRVRVVKLVLRVTRIGGKALERDIIGAINIGLRYLSADRSPVALGSRGIHDVRVKLVIPHRGATLLTVLDGVCKYL